MKKYECLTVWSIAAWTLVSSYVLFIVWALYYSVAVSPRLELERQNQINTFYAVHNCKPEGYVATKDNPVRTYRCDNGLYVAEDMK